MIWNFRAAHTHEMASITLHFAIVRQPFLNIVKHPSGPSSSGVDDSIMHPFAVSARASNCGFP